MLQAAPKKTNSSKPLQKKACPKKTECKLAAAAESESGACHLSCWVAQTNSNTAGLDAKMPSTEAYRATGSAQLPVDRHVQTQPIAQKPPGHQNLLGSLGT